MAIQFICPLCGKKLWTKEGLAGKKARCTGCAGLVVIPGATASSEPIPTAARQPDKGSQQEDASLALPGAVHSERALAGSRASLFRSPFRWIWIGAISSVGVIAVAGMAGLFFSRNRSPGPGQQEPKELATATTHLEPKKLADETDPPAVDPPQSPAVLPNGGTRSHSERAVASLPGADGPRVQDIRPPGEGIELTGVYVVDGLDPFANEIAERQRFPSRITKLVAVARFRYPPSNGTSWGFEVFDQAGSVVLKQQPTYTFSQGNSVLAIKPCEPASGAYRDGPYQAKLKINDQVVAVLNWSIGGPKPPGTAHRPRSDQVTNPSPGEPGASRRGDLIREAYHFQGSSVRVQCVGISQDGRRALCAGGTMDQKDYAIRLWDLETKTELRRFAGHKNDVLCVAFAPDGQRSLSCSRDKTIRLWDVNTGKERRRFTGVNYPQSVVFSPDGQYVLVGGWEGALRLWNANSGGESRRFEAPHYSNCVAFSPDGLKIAAGQGDIIREDYTVRVWDVKAGNETHCFKGHVSPVNRVAFSPDGRRVLSGSNDRTLRLWDLASGREIRVFTGHGRAVKSVAFLPDGRHFLSASDGTEDVITRLPGSVSRSYAFGGDSSIRIWDAATGDELQQVNKSASCIAVSGDGRKAVSCSFGSIVQVWELSISTATPRAATETRPPIEAAAEPADEQVLAIPVGEWEWASKGKSRTRESIDMTIEPNGTGLGNRLVFQGNVFQRAEGGRFKVGHEANRFFIDNFLGARWQVAVDKERGTLSLQTADGSRKMVFRRKR
jgi:WD40 repeat protein